MKPTSKLESLLLFLFLFSIFLNKTQAQSINDTILASQYFKKADSLLTDKKLDSSLVYFQKALPIYKNAKDWEKVASCYNKISQNQRANSIFLESLKSARKALEICKIYLPENNQEEINAYNHMAYTYQKTPEFDKALKYLQKALVIRQKKFSEDHLEVARSHVNIGTFYKNTAKYKLSLEHHKKALRIRQKFLTEYHADVAKSYNNIAVVYYHIGEYKTALQHHEKEVAVQLKVLDPDHPHLGYSYNDIANVYLALENYDKALDYYHLFLSIIIKNFSENHLYAAYSYNNMGLTYGKLMKYDNALDYYQKALPIFIENKYLNGIGAIYKNMGILFSQRGEYDKALEYHQKSLDIKLKTYGEHYTELGDNYMNIGIEFYNKANNEKALYYYDKGLQIFKTAYGENHKNVAEMYVNIGLVHTNKKEYIAALKYYKKAQAIFENIFDKNNPNVATINGNIGDIYLSEKKYDDAILYYQKDLEVKQNVYGDQHVLTLPILNQLAVIYEQQKEFKKAIAYYDKAILINNKISDAKTPFDPNQYHDLLELMRSLKGKAKILQHQLAQSNNTQYIDQIVTIYQNADLLIKHIRRSYQNFQDKVTFAKQSKEIYSNALKFNLLLNKTTKDLEKTQHAFYYAEKSKSNVLNELLNDSYAKNFANLPEEIIENEKTLRTNRAFYTSQITKEQFKSPIDTSKIKEYENKLFDINRKQDSIIGVLGNKYPKYYQLKYQNNIITITDIQKKLDNQTTLLEFFTTDSITYAFTISKNNLSVKQLTISGLTEKIEQLREAVVSKNTKAFKSTSHQLYKELIVTIKDQIVGNNLIIIPDGPLWHLNFDLLLTQNTDLNNPKEFPYLLHDYAISYANSANLLFNPFKSNKEPKKRQECLAFSFSDSSVVNTESISLRALRDTGDDLPGTRKEIKAISDIIDGQYYFGSEAIETNFKKDAGNYNILHLALHGEVDNEHPENSKLFFTKSKDTIEDNLLYSHELFALDLPTELTVLSACNTGAGKIAKGEGIMSLGNAFQYAGTKSLLLSSWEVSDQTTPELMKYFYTNLKEGMNKAKALQQAKLQYLNTAHSNRTHPFYWGGFYLVGDSTSMQFSDNSLLYWGIGFGILIILFLGYFSYRRKIKTPSV